MTRRQVVGAAVTALTVASVVFAGCGADDNGGVITPAKTTTTAVRS